jgi:hypothetical protein
MSANTCASWSAHDLSTQRGMPPGLTSLRGLTRLNLVHMLATEEESPQSLVKSNQKSNQIKFYLSHTHG